MKGIKRKICSALCCLSVLSGVNKVESFSFKDACRLARKVPDVMSRITSFLWHHIIWGWPGAIINGGMGTLLLILKPEFREPYYFGSVASGYTAFLNVCNGFYPEEDEQSSKSDDKIGKEKKKETNKKDATENSLENKEKLTSKDKSSS